MLTALSFDALLEELAAPRPAPAAGSALAAALAGAAAVVQMAARLSASSWPDAAGVAAQAESLRGRAAALVDEDAEAFRRALEAQEGPQRIRPSSAATSRSARSVGGGGRAAAPARAAGGGRRRAGRRRRRARRAARSRGRRGRGCACRRRGPGAGALVAVNLTAVPGDPRVAEAERLASAADAIARRLRLVED